VTTERPRPLLIVEDDLALQKQLRWSFDQFETLTAENRESALAQIHRHNPAVVTMDLGLPPDADSVSEGFRLLEQILAAAPDTKVIVLTGQNDHANALRAIALGAYDFFAKPFEPELLALTIDRAFRLHDLQQENRRLLVNCAAIPENLLESELFGYEKGAFTGAAKTTPGKIETADGGTLMLDEIGDLPLPLQAKLLRFLQERVVERLGGRQEIPVDVRIVCATHQDLKAQISDGRFREDLYYRLAEIVVPIPPLRERVGDATLLAHAFVHKFAEEQKRGSMTLGEDAIRAIETHRWPGNVRELENCVKRAVIMADGAHITQDDIGLNGNAADDFEFIDLRKIRDDAERQAVVTALGRTNGNLLKTSEILGISRPTLYDLMHRLGLK